MLGEKRPSWKRHLITFIIAFAVVGLFALQSRSCRPQGRQAVRPEGARIVEIKIGRGFIQAEVADTDALRTKGLSGRQTLEPGYGMLFVFDEPQAVRFWMKDTLVPLSIAFIKEDGTIVQIEDMQPNDLRIVQSREPVKYALEVRQGWFKERGLGPGIKAELPEKMPSPPATTAK